jgi:phosphoadenosine phosphosulfate reductase
MTETREMPSSAIDGVSALRPASTSGVMGKSLVGVLVMGDPALGGLQHFERLRQTYGGLDGLGLLRAVLKDGPLAGRIALVSSFGAESAVLLDMVASVDPATPVIFLDTLKLFPETHGHREALVELLQLRDVRVVRPEHAALARRDPRGDLWQHDPDACCQLRKTAALQTALAGFEAWITGRKRFQGGVRWQLPTIEPEWSCDRIKINPLAPWSAEDVERYQVLRNLPKHPLADQGYRSIGCVPCTRPVSAREPERAGRWWGLDKSECGIHLVDEAS